jgi:hypothetical protein
MNKVDKNKKTQRQKWMRIMQVVMICLPLFAILLLLKIQSAPALSLPSEDENAAQAQSSEVIAKPDTSTSIENLAVVADAAADTIFNDQIDAEDRDMRSPAEAGAEDGYWDGYYDGAARDTTRQRFNDDCQFTQQMNRETYAKHYAEGYHQGFAEGKAMK